MRMRQVLVGASMLAVAAATPVKDTKGHLGSWVFNVVDNTTNH